MANLLLNNWQAIKKRSNIKILFIMVFVFKLFQSPNIFAEDKKPDSIKSNSTPISAPDNKTSKISWPTNQVLQSKNNKANESFWIDVANEKVLVLKYRARGRIFRGNAILLHAQGENADHPKVIRPLANQLSGLGWHVFIPNLPLENFPASVNPKKDTNKSELSKIKANYSFKDFNAYQQHINQTLKNLIPKVQPQSTQFFLLGNKSSAYWLLESAKNLPDIKQIVLFDPQTPNKVKIDLKNSFNGQFLPVYTFIKNNKTSQNFLNGFELQLWKSNFQRLNRNMINHNSIPIEDNRIAKSITGWIKTQEKK